MNSILFMKGWNSRSQFLFARILERRSADDYRYVSRVRQYVQYVLDVPVHVELDSQQRVSLSDRTYLFKVRSSTAAYTVGVSGKRRCRCRCAKPDCRAADRHYQIRLSPHEQCLQIVDKGRVFQRGSCASGHECNLDQVHWLPESLGQFFPEGRWQRR